MLRFILADLTRFRLGAVVVVLIVALAVALGVAVTLQERALRLGSARAAEKFDLIIGAAGSETQLVLSSVFLRAHHSFFMMLFFQHFFLFLTHRNSGSLKVGQCCGTRSPFYVRNQRQ